ncbi:DUF2922 domain-containing protein [Clostridium culturomicium]|uniref:DUF2922 domain-containing protein n=1 Tax=Clostridium culturomicium TaxID=1499683 RepID=UPI0005911B22|nr:DUF2922 domain-containing protein [Clostridium culturomicium]
MERKLVMSFKDIAGAKFNLIVNSVKDEVTAEEINGIMDAVLETGAIVSKNGALIEKLTAVIVDTTETDFDVQ